MHEPVDEGWHASGEEERGTSGKMPEKNSYEVGQRAQFPSGNRWHRPCGCCVRQDAFPFVPWHVPRFVPSADPRPMFHPFHIEARLSRITVSPPLFPPKSAKIFPFLLDWKEKEKKKWDGDGRESCVSICAPLSWLWYVSWLTSTILTWFTSAAFALAFCSTTNSKAITGCHFSRRPYGALWNELWIRDEYKLTDLWGFRESRVILGWSVDLTMIGQL